VKSVNKKLVKKRWERGIILSIKGDEVIRRKKIKKIPQSG